MLFISPVNTAFENRDLLELFTHGSGKYAKKLSPVIIDRFFGRMEDVLAALDMQKLYQLKGARLEKVPSECLGCYSMRLNDQWRLILKFEAIDGQPGAVIVDVRDYH